MVGLASATLINLNGAVGAGIFALPAMLYVGAGSYAPLAILAFAAFYASFIAIIAKLSTLFEQSGGPQLYLHHAFGEIAGFQAGWLTVCGNMAARAANFHVMVAYLAALFPVFGGPMVQPLTVVGLILLFTAISIAGTRQAIGALWVGTVLKLAPLMVLCVAGLWANGLPSETRLPDFSEFEATALILAYAFSGMAVAPIAAGEVNNPTQTLRRSMFWNLAIVALFYAFIQFAFQAINPEVINAESSLSAAGEAVFGSFGVALISFAAIFSIGTGQLNYFVVMPRILYGMGRRGSLPRIFAFLSDRLKTPVAAILIYSAIIIGLALSGTFATLAVLTVAADVLIGLAMLAALYRVWRSNDGGIAASMGPRWIAIGVIGLFFLVWLGLQIPLSAIAGTAGMLLAGLLLYWLAQRVDHEHEEIRIIQQN